MRHLVVGQRRAEAEALEGTVWKPHHGGTTARVIAVSGRMRGKTVGRLRQRSAFGGAGGLCVWQPRRKEVAVCNVDKATGLWSSP